MGTTVGCPSYRGLIEQSMAGASDDVRRFSR
jgi:hypothetical protein